MSISIKRYVDITSGVGGAAVVAQRDFGGRIITDSTSINPGQVVETTNADDVGTLFGTTSREYQYALMYFGYVNKQIKKPQRLSFFRRVAAAVPPIMLSDTTTKNIPAIAAMTNGTIGFSSNGAAPKFVSIDFTGSLTGADVAAKATVVFQSSQIGGMTWNAANNQFTVTGFPAGEGTQVVVDAQQNNVAQLLGLTTPGSSSIPGYNQQTPADAVSTSAQISDNFGSFSFISSQISQSDLVSVASWNHAQNVKFIYCALVPRSQAATVQPLLAGFSGCALHTIPDAQATSPTYTENCPMEVLGSTDYTRPAASQNYMYQVFGNRPATVTDDTEADTLDGLRVNYIGQTQTAGQQLAFYQRGLLQGDVTTAPVDINTYANEMWLKDRLQSDILNMFLSLPSVSANDAGRAQLLSIVQPGLQDAKTNGTISVGKPLTALQKAFITQVTADPTAWHQVQVSGYWIDVQLVSYVNSVTNATEWKASYTLIYSKDDQIRKVEGSDILI